MQDETKKLPNISLSQQWWFGWLRGWRANDVTKLKLVGFLVPPWQTTKEILLQPLDDAHDRDDELDDAHFRDNEFDNAHHCDDELKDTHYCDDGHDDAHQSYDDDN